jgi:Putative beta-barrel porin-2, OmpL-like. bbp2
MFTPQFSPRVKRKSSTKFIGLNLALIGSLVFSPLTGLAFTLDELNGKAPAAATDNKPGENGKDAKKDAPEAAKTETKSETSRIIELLEERVRALEEKISQLTGASAPKETVATTTAAVPAAGGFAVNVPSMTATATPAAAPTAVVAQDAKPDPNAGALNFFKDVEVSGIVDGYYSYNNNKVDMFTQNRAFDVRHNAFSLQLASIRLERKNSKDNPLGFRVDLGVGETVDRIISVSDSSRNDATKHVLQAYASYVAPVGSGLTFDFGKFYTPVGAEVIETKDNFNYSRSLLFTYGPYYHAGLRTKYAFNDKVALTGFLVNGWDNLFENNVKTGKTGGFQLSLTPSKKFALNQTYLVGKEAPLANVPDVSLRDNVRHVADTVATVYVTDKFTLLGNMVFGSDGDNGARFSTRGKWQGYAGYFKYAFTPNLAFSPRFEVLRDRDGIRTGTGQTIKDITLTQEFKLKDNFITRVEYRRDFSDANVFTNSRGFKKDEQNTFIIGVSYFFTTKGQ